jgi:hypothetical protein
VLTPGWHSLMVQASSLVIRRSIEVGTYLVLLQSRHHTSTGMSWKESFMAESRSRACMFEDGMCSSLRAVMHLQSTKVFCCIVVGRWERTTASKR